MSNVRYLSWPAMILDAAPDVRAQGYLQVPDDLQEARAGLARALAGGDDVLDDALTFLVDRGGPVARTILVEALDNRPPYACHPLRAAIGEIDVRRHAPDPRVVLPPFQPWPDSPAPLGFAERLYDIVARWIGMERQSLQVGRRLTGERGEDEQSRLWRIQTERDVAAHEAITLEHCAEAVRAIEGSGGRVHPLIRKLTDIRFADEVGPMLTPLQRLRLDWEPDRPHVLMWSFDYAGVDLRHFADSLGRLGVARPEAIVARDYLLGDYLLPTLAWPFFVEHPERLEDCLGLAVPEMPVEDAWLIKALGVLAQMPVMPSRYLPRVTDLSVTGPARPRTAARRVVEAHGDPLTVATGALGHSRGAVRSSAAQWLGEQGATAALPALREALAREGSAPARTALAAVIGRLEG
ncbi:hypothetical protein [Cellulomonas sp. P5_C5]